MAEGEEFYCCEGAAEGEGGVVGEADAGAVFSAAATAGTGRRAREGGGVGGWATRAGVLPPACVRAEVGRRGERGEGVGPAFAGGG